jgi:AsmA protein
MIPDVTFDLAPLREFDADLRFALAQVVQGDFNASAVEGRFVSAAGQARLDPFAATLPGGPVTLTLAADARPDVPSVQVAGTGRNLDFAALLTTLGSQAPMSGRADVEMDLRGQGNGLRALAATANGHFGLAVVDARLGGDLAQTLQQITPALGPGAALACLAFRLDIEQGVARVTTLFLDGAAGRLAGEGTIRLSDEALSMRLLTDLRVAGIRLRAPVPLTGRLMAPRLESQGLLAGALGGGRMPSLPDCATTLRVARGGREGPVPAPTPSADTPADGAQRPPLIQGVPPVVNDLLRGFLRQ